MTQNRPICEAMGKIIELAERAQRVPVGQWLMPLHDGWELRMNGTGETWDGIPPYSALVSDGGLRMAVIDPFGGSLVGVSEDELITRLDNAKALLQEPVE